MSKNRPSQPQRGPMGGMGMPVVKPKDFKGGAKNLLLYLSPYKLQLIFIVIVAIISTVFSIVGPKILALATDELVKGSIRIYEGSTIGINFQYIGKLLLILLALYLLSSIFSYLQGHIMSNISSKVSFDLRAAIVKKINSLSISYFHKTTHGDVLSRITNDVDTLNQNLNQSIIQLITSAATVIGVLIMMFTISPILALVALCIIPISLVLVTTVVKQSQKHFKGQQKYLGSVNGHIEEIYGGHIVVKAFNAEDDALAMFEKENEKLCESAWKAQFYSGIIHPLMNFVGNIGYVAICIVGAYLVTNSKMTIGGIQAFIQYVRSFTFPISQLANISSQFQQMVAASERIFEFLEEAEEVIEQPKITMKDINIKGNVKFSNVKFGYEVTDKIVINDFSADIKSGQKVAIVGPTGAGKTTIVKLLMRFHDLTDGAIYIDGHSITDFTRKDLRSEFGMVLQDTWLFSGTIMENIRYGKTNASDNDVKSAAKAAQVDHFIRTLPGGYNMELNEETTNISQGQKQLLTIARAILADSKILILDEATSSVDARTEILIQKAMDNLMKGRTSFIIAHRLSTIKNADLILYMKDGDIAEQGTHEHLMAKGGFYANLYNSQFEKVS